MRCICRSSRNPNGSFNIFNHGVRTRTEPIDQCTQLLVPATTWYRTYSTVVGQYHRRLSTRISNTDNDSPESTHPSCPYTPEAKSDSTARDSTSNSIARSACHNGDHGSGRRALAVEAYEHEQPVGEQQ